MAERRRILLAEVTPGIPPPRQHATWSTSDKTGVITLSGGNLTVTGSSSGRPPLPFTGVRADLPLAAGRYYWEVRSYASTINPNPGIGIYQHPGTPGQYLNENPATTPDFHSLLLRLDGYLWHGGAPIGYVGALSFGAVVRVLADTDARTIAVAVGAGSWLTMGEADLNPGFFDVPLHAAVSTNTNDVFVANFGGYLVSDPFVHPVPADCRAGVYVDPPAVPTTLYFSSETFGTGSAETPPDRQYHARIARDPDVEVERSGGCWVWGGQSSSRRGSLTLVNPDGGLSALHGYVWRDAPITLLSGYAGDARAAFTAWTVTTVDHIERAADGRITLALTDPLSLFDRALQPKLYPDDQPNAQAAGKPLPLVIGRPMYCEAVRLDTNPAVRDYDAHDGTVAGPVGPNITIAEVYDAGDLFAPGDWAYRLDGAGSQVGFTLANAPYGRVVCNPIGPTQDGAVMEAARQILAHLGVRAWHAAGRPGLPPYASGIGETLLGRLAYFTAAPVSVLEVMRQVMDSHLGWIWARRDGTYDSAVVLDPESSAPVLVLDARNVARVAVRDDEAKGLTLRIAGRRNNTPHSDSEIAGSVPLDPRSVPLDLRAELRSGMTITRTANTLAGSAVTSFYAHAAAAPPQETLLQDASDIQAMANRVATLWRRPRQFYEVDALLGSSAADALEPGQVVRLTWSRHGLSVDRNLLVVSVTSRFFSRRVPLLLWG